MSEVRVSWVVQELFSINLKGRVALIFVSASHARPCGSQNVARVGDGDHGYL